MGAGMTGRHGCCLVHLFISSAIVALSFIPSATALPFSHHRPNMGKGGRGKK
jgi:hypothetical protein